MKTYLIKMILVLSGICSLSHMAWAASDISSEDFITTFISDLSTVNSKSNCNITATFDKQGKPVVIKFLLYDKAGPFVFQFNLSSMEESWHRYMSNDGWILRNGYNPYATNGELILAQDHIQMEFFRFSDENKNLLRITYDFSTNGAGSGQVDCTAKPANK